MRGRVTVSTVCLVVLLAVLPASVGAEGPVVVNGGGTGTIDGATPFSQFGLGLSIQPDGAVRGHFECLMAGRSAVPGLHLMSVGGQVTSASVLGEVATLDGVGTLNMGDQGKVRGQRFRVTLKAGGPQEGMLQLTLIEPVAMVLPPETVLTGRLEVH